MSLHCPYCRTLVESAEASPLCPSCGRNLRWLTPQRDFVIHEVDLWQLNSEVRKANVCVLLLIQCYLAVWAATTALLPVRAAAVAMVLSLPLHVGLAMAFKEASAALSPDGDASLFDGVCAALPGVNLLAIALLNLRAWRSFRRIGLPWHPGRWSERSLAAAFQQAFCHVCGYNLTGNVSGVCPECGSAVARGPVRAQSALPADSDATVRGREARG